MSDLLADIDRVIREAPPATRAQFALLAMCRYLEQGGMTSMGGHYFIVHPQHNPLMIDRHTGQVDEIMLRTAAEALP